MKFLVFCFENLFPLTSLIKIISEKYEIDLSILNEIDFIKSNNSYIYKNQENINKILDLNKDLSEVDQVLYFETELALIPYINIVEYDDENVLNNLKNNYIIPKYFNNKDYINYYLIDFNIIDYIKFIHFNNTFDENIDKLKDLSNLVSNFDVVKCNIQFKKINVFSIENEDDDEYLFDTFIDNIKKLTHTNNNDFYKFDGYYSTILIITDDKINKFINNLETDQLEKLLDLDDYLWCHTQIEVYNKILNKIKIDYMTLSSIFDDYKNNPTNILISNDIDWAYVGEYHNYNSQRMDTYFVIECKNLDKIRFV